MDPIIPYVRNLILDFYDRIPNLTNANRNNPIIGSFLNGLCAGLGIITAFIITDTVLEIFSA